MTKDDARQRLLFRCGRFLLTLLVSGVPSGATTYVLFAARPSNAVAKGPPKHDAVAQEVAVDARLAHAERGWSIELEATNAAAAERTCTVTAALTRTQSNPMSRVISLPRIVWSSAIAITVPARGRSPQRLLVPPDIAKDITEPKPARLPTDASDRFGVQVQMVCGGHTGVS